MLILSDFKLIPNTERSVMSGGWTSHQADGRQVSREKVTRTFLTMSWLGSSLQERVR